MRAIGVRKRSIKSENAAALEIGGRRQLASGALPGMKGDVRSPDYLLEDKFTDKRSYPLHLDILEKAEREAFASRRKALLRVTLQGKVFYVVSRRVFLHLHNQNSNE